MKTVVDKVTLRVWRTIGGLPSYTNTEDVRIRAVAGVKIPELPYMTPGEKAVGFYYVDKITVRTTLRHRNKELEITCFTYASYSKTYYPNAKVVTLCQLKKKLEEIQELYRQGQNGWGDLYCIQELVTCMQSLNITYALDFEVGKSNRHFLPVIKMKNMHGCIKVESALRDDFLWGLPIFE